MATNPDYTEFAVRHGLSSHVSVAMLVEHLEALGRYEIGVGEANAKAARLAATLIRSIAETYPHVLDLENAELLSL